MGADPLGALVSLALPPELSVEAVEGLYEGLRSCGQCFACPLVGGDTTRSPGPLMVGVSAWGRTTPERLRLRSGAQVGDVVAVTGTLGDAAAGLHRLLHPQVPGVPHLEQLLRAHWRPVPRLPEARCLTEEAGVHALIDLSDGLAGDAGHLAASSGVRIRLRAEALPLSEAVRHAAERWGCDPLEWALYGGEDYELLFTCAPSCWESLVGRLASATGTPATAVGEVVASHPEGEVELEREGRIQPLRGRGYTHF
jgi:thiamine-monophosphate kinase